MWVDYWGGGGGGGGGWGGGQRVCWPHPPKVMGGGPGPPSSYTYELPIRTTGA